MLNLHKKLISGFINAEIHAIWLNGSNPETINTVIYRAEEYTKRLGIPSKIEVMDNGIGFSDVMKTVALTVNDGKSKNVMVFRVVL